MSSLDTTRPRPLDGWPDEPFLSGNFAPVLDELDVPDLKVTGEIPATLNGAFLRNGPNPAYPPLGKYNWFDGDGMVHAVYLDNGTARYKNRFVETVGLRHERAAGKAIYGGIDNFVFPPENIFLEQGGPLKNVANTAFAYHGGRLLTLWETGNPHEITYDLDTVGLYDFNEALPGGMTAHPKIDPTNGFMYFFGMSPIAPHLSFHAVEPSGKLVRSEIIDIPRGVMMHDFQIAGGKAIFLDSPAAFNLDAAMSGGPAIGWNPDFGCRIGVLDLDKSADTIQWYEIDPCYAFHFMNGWVEGDVVFFDCALTPDFALPDSDMALDTATVNYPHLTRFEVNTTSGTVTVTEITDRNMEFPIVNPDYVGLKNRYAYSPGATRSDSLKFDLLVKYDHQEGTDRAVSLGDRSSGDPTFVADPAGENEDDGWILTLAHDDDANQTCLEVFAAQDLSHVATVEMPRRVPAGFHSQWVPAEFADG